MTALQWLLALHVTGAFLVLGGTVAAGILSALALRARLPSEVALFLGLGRITAVVVSAGALLTLVFGLVLVRELRLSYGRPWIVESLVLLAAASLLGRAGAAPDAQIRRLALRLAEEGDAAAPQLRARLRAPLRIALSSGAAVAVVGVLALMIWKPGG